MTSSKQSQSKMTGLLLLVTSIIFVAGVIPGLGRSVVQYDIRGVPLRPGETIWGTGHFAGDVNIWSGYGRVGIPLYTLVGRGNVAFPLNLYYSTEVKDMESVKNNERQASWVGMGWGLDAPYIFGTLDVMVGGRDPDIYISSIDTDYNLFWTGIDDPIKSTGTWELKYRKYWKLEKTLDDFGYVDSFTLTDLNGTKYTFGHRRITCVTLWNSEQEMVDRENYVPYRWDLTKIEDVTQNNNNTISIVYEDVNGTCYGRTYTQASYLDTITCDASGRYLAFVLEDRTDKQSSSPDPAEIYEQKRLNYVILKNSGGTTLWRYNPSYIYHASGDYQKLLLDKIQQRKPDNSTGLPAWKFHYRTNAESNPGALEILTAPQGGTKTFAYATEGSNWRVSSVSIDRKMGAGSETTSYSDTGINVTVTPPGNIGTIQYYLNSGAYKLNAGTLNRITVSDSSNQIVARAYYTLEDSTITYRKYDEERRVTYIPYSGEPLDSLSVHTWTTYSTLNGLPDYIKEEVSPFEPRGFSIDTTPSQKHLFHRTRSITYAASVYSGMNASGTHQLAAMHKEIIREEVKENGTTWKTAPISATKITWTEPGGQNYYRPSKYYIWTGADAAGDTTILWSSSETVTIREIENSDSYGHVLQEKDGEGRITRYYYGDNTNNLDNTANGLQHRFLTGVSRVAGNDSLTSKTDWNGDMGLVTEVEDANGSKMKTEYDDYYRPITIKNHDNDILTEITYSFARDQSGDDSFDSSKPNYNRSKSHFKYLGSTEYTYSTVFTDGWGQTLQTHRRNGNNDIIQAFGYYADGSLRATYTPYDTSNSDHSYENPANFGKKDSTLYAYEPDPRRRLKNTIYPTMDTSTRPSSSVSYTISSITSGPAKYHRFIKVTATDENGVTHESWVGASGGVLKTRVGGSYAAETWRNVLGTAAMILPPRTGGSRTSPLRTDITNSPFGREIERDEPDQNTTKTVYDRNLVPIYVQEATDAGGYDFWATLYDGFGRISRIGKEDAANNNWYERHPVIPNSAYGSEADEWRKKYTYDSDQFGSGTTYPKGRLTKVEGNYDTEDDTAEYYEWYQYRREGWITKQRQYVEGAITRDVEYEYDTGGKLRKVIFADAQNSEEFFIWYDYDSAGRLYKIYSHTSNSKPGTATAEYAYNARGQITQEKLGGTVQQVDFTYNARGFLTKINDPGSLGTDRFAMQLGYDAKVTGGPSTGWSAENNGNISQLKWVNTKFSSTAYYYTFGYDSRDQLTKADCSNNSWDVSSYSYDNNGNLSGLNRGTAWTYYYDGDENNTNRVDNISSLTSDDNWDYDSNGRQTKDTNGSFSSCTYHFPGAAFHNITMSSGTLQMRYNASNRRLQKISGTTINYVRDINGQVLAVYEGTTIEERYVWGPLGLVSIVKGNNTSPTRYYTITGHLGSISSVVNAGGTAVAGYDNYPFGKELRSSVSGDADSRFKFGAKEFDTQLNLDLYYFEARFYRPDVGRYLSPDPIREGWTHYAYVENNPLIRVDPSGLRSEETSEPHLYQKKGDLGKPEKREWPGGLPCYDSRKNMDTPYKHADNKSTSTMRGFFGDHGFWKEESIDWLNPEHWYMYNEKPDTGWWLEANKDQFKKWYEKYMNYNTLTGKNWP